MPRSSTPLPQQIAQDLMRRILGHEFDGTTILPSERTLQEAYGVSRTVIREALKLLAARGLIQTGNGQGAVISANQTAPAIDAVLLAFHSANVRLADVLDTRLLLEPEIAALAARYATSLQIRRLHDLGDELAKLATAEHPARAASSSVDLNAQFHTLIAEASQNPVLMILIEILVGIVWRQENTVNTQTPPENHKVTAAQHERIVGAIAERDPAAAKAAMAAHLESTRESLADYSLRDLIHGLYDR